MSLKFTVYRVTLELATDLLGTNPKDKAIFTSYIQDAARKKMEKEAKKGIALADGTEANGETIAAALAEEPEDIQQMEERGWTGFFEDKDGPYLTNFMVKGFLKEAARTLKEWGKIKQLKDKVSRYVFIKPRKIRLPKINLDKLEPEHRQRVPEGHNFPVLERPLRAETPKGPRVTLLRSDYIPAGTQFCFEMWVLAGAGLTTALLKDVLEYAEYQGFGQWRGGGFGSAQVVEMAKIRDDTAKGGDAVEDSEEEVEADEAA